MIFKRQTILALVNKKNTVIMQYIPFFIPVGFSLMIFLRSLTFIVVEDIDALFSFLIILALMLGLPYIESKSIPLFLSLGKNKCLRIFLNV